MPARRWNRRVCCFLCTLLLQSIVAAVAYAPAHAQRLAAGHVSAFQLAPFPLASSAQRDFTSRRKQTARRTCTHTTWRRKAGEPGEPKKDRTAESDMTRHVWHASFSCDDSFAVSSGYSLNLWAHLFFHLCVFLNLCRCALCVFVFAF